MNDYISFAKVFVFSTCYSSDERQETCKVGYCFYNNNSNKKLLIILIVLISHCSLIGKEYMSSLLAMELIL